MKAPLSSNNRQTNNQSYRNTREEPKVHTYTPNNNHLYSANFHPAHPNTATQGLGYYDEYFKTGQKSPSKISPFHPSSSIGPQPIFRPSSDRSYKDEPIALKHHVNQTYFKSGQFNDERLDTQQKQTHMSSTDQNFYRPQLDQSPQANAKTYSAQRRNRSMMQSNDSSMNREQDIYKIGNFQIYNPASHQQSVQQFDIEQLMLNLHNKMKNLEGKYIDLANFYKKELIQSQEDAYGRLRNSQQRSPLRARKDSNFDQNQEYTIINELKQEKFDLEQELENVMQVQTKLQQEEIKLQDKLDQFEKENNDLKIQSLTRAQPPLPSSTQIEISKIELLRKQLAQLLAKFEKEFLDFINSNYSSFTENDVLGLFGSLRRQIETLMDQILKKSESRSSFSHRSSLREEVPSALDDQKRQLIEKYKRDVEEMELNQEYALQNFKKCSFDLSNRLETQKIDFKKFGISLSLLQNSASELNSSMKTSQNFFAKNEYQSNTRSTSAFRRQQVDMQPLSGQQSPSQATNQQLKLMGEILSQTNQLSAIYANINLKMNEQERDLGDLSKIEELNAKNINSMKNSIMECLSKLETMKPNQQQQMNMSIDRGSIEDQQQYLLNERYMRQINDLKNLNDKLQHELKLYSDDVHLLKQEKQQILSEYEKMKRNKTTPMKDNYVSPFREGYSSGKKRASSQQPNYQNDLNYLQNKCTQLEIENDNLSRQLKLLYRQLDDKNEELEKLTSQNNMLRNINNQNLDQSAVEQDQLRYYQQQYQKYKESLKLIIKQAQKFIHSMRKLQKAVHRKEPNVSKEKQEFETTKKELEETIKILKKELDQEKEQERPEQQMSLTQTITDKLFANKQNSAGRTRIQEKQNLSQVRAHQQNLSQRVQTFNMTQTQPYLNNSLQQELRVQERQSKSPSRFNAQRYSNYSQAHNKAKEQSQYHQRSNNIYQASAEKLENRSPSIGGRSHQKSKQEPSEDHNYQLLSLQRDYDNLKQECKQAQFEQDLLRRDKMTIERQLEQVNIDKQNLEYQIERERRRVENLQREKTDLEFEKNNILHEAKNVKQVENEETIKQMNFLEEELEIQQQMNRDNKRTIQMLEESEQLAKQTIIDLKEAMGGKDKELSHLEQKLQDLVKKEGTAQIRSDELKKLRNQLLEQIEEVDEENKMKLNELSEMLNQKEQKLQQLKRNFERKVKEREMLEQQEKNKRSDSDLKQKVENLQSYIKSKDQCNYCLDLEQEKSLQQKQYEQSEALKKQIQTKDQQLAQAKQRTQNELASLEQKLKSHFDNYLQEQIEIKENEHQKEVQSLNLKNSEKLKEYEEKSQGKIQELEQEFQQKIQAEIQNQMSQKSNVNKNLDDLQKQLNQKLKELSETQAKLEDQKKQQSSIEQSKNEREKEILKINEIMKEMDKQINKKNEHIKKIEASYKNLEEEKNAINKIKKDLEQQLQINKSQENTQLKKTMEEKVNEEKQKVKSLSDQHKNALKDIDDLNRTVKDLNQVIREKETGSQSKINQILESNQKQIHELQTQLNGVNLELETKQNQVNQYKEQLQKAQKEILSTKQQSLALQNQVHEIQQNQQQAETQFQEEKQKLQQHYEKQITTLRDQNEQAIQNLKKSHQEQLFEKDGLISQLDNEKDEIQAQLETLSIEHQKLDQYCKKEKQNNKQQISNLEARIKSQDEQIEQLQGQGNAQASDLQNKIDNLYSQVKQKDEEIQSLKKEKIKKQQEAEEHQQLRKQKEGKVEQLSKEMGEKDKQIAQIKKEVQKYEAKVNDLQGQIQEKENDLKMVQQNIKMLEENGQKQTQQIQQLNGQLKEKNGVIQSKESQIVTQNNSITFLNEKLSEKDQEIEKLKSLTTTLETQKQSESSQKQEVDQERGKLQQKIKEEQEKQEGLKQQLKDLTDENQYIKSQKQSLQEQVEQMNEQIQSKEQELNSQEQNMKHDLTKKESTIKKKDKEIEGLEETCRDLESQLDKAHEDFKESQKQFQYQMQDQRNQITKLEEQISQKNKEHEQQIKNIEQSLKEMQSERDQANEQFKNMINQTQVESASVEHKLQTSLQETFRKLENKEKELQDKQEEIKKLNNSLTSLKKQMVDMEEALKIKQEEWQQVQEELNEAEERIGQLQQQHEKHRDIIQKLRESLSQQVEKNNQASKEKDQQLSQKEKDLSAEIAQLKDQVSKLKNEFEDMVIDKQMQIDEKESELKLKDQMIEEVNDLIEGFNNEKHEIKAKFKHLLQVYDSVIEESSYKEDEEVNLEECFDLMEKELVKNKQLMKNQIQELQVDNSQLKQLMIQKEEEMAEQQVKLNQVQMELMNALNKQESNDMEIRKQLDIAQRKVTNYKEKLKDKQKMINQLESAKRRQEDPDKSLDKDIALIQKLQQKDAEIQQLRQQLLLKQNTRSNRENDDDENDSQIKIDNLRNIEDNINELKVQLIQVKESVTKKIKEEYDLKIKEMQIAYQNPSLLHAKLRDADPKGINWNTSLKELKRLVLSDGRALMILHKNNEELEVVDESKLNETTLDYIRSFNPEVQEIVVEVNESEQQHMGRLTEQIQETYEEIKELQSELLLYKQKLISGEKPTYHQLQLYEQTDEINHLTADNNEQRLKVKELILQNLNLKTRIIELNQLYRESLKGDNSAQAERLMKLLDENDQLRKSITKHRQSTKNVEEEKKGDYSDDFIVGLKSSAKGLHEPGEYGFENKDFLNDTSLANYIDDIPEPQGAATQQLQQKITQLQQKLDDKENVIQRLNQELSKQKEETFDANGQIIIDNVKGTLLKFLKNCPITDKNNEDLLTVIYSIMGFSKEEMQDINSHRNIKGRNTSQSGATDPDDDSKKNKKRGFFGFGKKEKEPSLNRVQGAGSGIMGPSPMKPLRKN